VHAVFVGGDVDIDEVTLLEDRVIWDSVTDDLVERGAARFWVPPVPERRRVRPVGHDKVVGNRVQLVGGDPGFHRCSRCLDGTRRDFSGRPDELDLFCTVDIVTLVIPGGLSPDVFRCDDR